MPIGVACPTFSNEEKTVERRREVIGLICSRLIKARAFRQKIQFIKFPKNDDFRIFCEVSTKKNLDTWDFPWSGEYKINKDLEESEIEGIDIFGIPMISTQRWVSHRTEDFSIIQAKADWALGHFHLRRLSYLGPEYGGPDEVGFAYSKADIFALEVQSEGIKRLLGVQVTDDVGGNARATTYDWEAAFADVAAAFYHDIEFQSLEARGVQTEIVDLLRSSFESRGVAVPSDDTLKPKARKLLGALRAKKP